MSTVYPYKDRCRSCGAEFEKRSGHHIYCASCAENRKQVAYEKALVRQRLYQKRKTAERRRIREMGKPAPVYQPSETECRARGCMYSLGDGSGCNYFTMTGRLRSVRRDEETGKVVREHEIINGKCDLYRKRTRKGPVGWRTIADRTARLREE